MNDYNNNNNNNSNNYNINNKIFMLRCDTMCIVKYIDLRKQD